MTGTLPLFAETGPGTPGTDLPGLRYAEDVISLEARVLFLAWAGSLDFAPFDFRGFKGNRRTVSFGSRYDFTHGRVGPAHAIPEELLALRSAAAEFAAIPDGDLVQALVTEYAPGAGIGWHRDRPEYGKVVGLSFGASCSLRFRRPDPGGWRRLSHTLHPGSAYLLDGSARDDWQHSIVPGDALRYSVTFRTMRSGLS